MMQDGIEDLYQDAILRHSRAPAHHLLLQPFDAEASGDNPMCGDRCAVRLRYRPDGSIDAVGFQARGCAISLASADLMAAAAARRTPSGLRELAREFEILARTGHTASADPALQALKPLSGVAAYPSRIKCATLPWAALIAALDGAGEASSE